MVKLMRGLAGVCLGVAILASPFYAANYAATQIKDRVDEAHRIAADDVREEGRVYDPSWLNDCFRGFR